MDIKKRLCVVMLVLVMSSCLQHQWEAGYCVAVFDGDTFELESGEIVRLIGIDSPERSEPGGQSARDYLSSLILRRRVVLVRGDQERDDYDRLLRYGYVNGLCVNEEMIGKGYAEVRYIAEDDPHREDYLQLEEEAEKNEAGLWSYGIFQPRSLVDWNSDIPVIDWREAEDYYGQYVIVEGTIVDTYNSGQACFLNFHQDWRQYLTIVIFACDFPSFPAHPKSYYLGKKVQVIGIVKRYENSLEIVVKTFDQIKILE